MRRHGILLRRTNVTYGGPFSKPRQRLNVHKAIFYGGHLCVRWHIQSGRWQRNGNMKRWQPERERGRTGGQLFIRWHYSFEGILTTLKRASINTSWQAWC